MNEIREEHKELYRIATTMLEKAYCPYSGFQVGAALKGKSGRIYTGVNVENASYGATICAERSAVSAAVTQGARRFTKIAIVGSSADAWPCGICRQVLREFSDLSLPVIVGAPGKGYAVRTLGELLPESFGPEDLGVDVAT